MKSAFRQILIIVHITECNLQFTFFDLKYLRRIIFAYFSIFKTNINVIGCWLFFLNGIYCTWSYDFPHLFTKKIMYPPSELEVSSISVGSTTGKCYKWYNNFISFHVIAFYSKSQALTGIKTEILLMSFDLSKITSIIVFLEVSFH